MTGTPGPRGPPAADQLENDLAVRHGKTDDRIDHVAQLSGGPLEELLPRGNIEEEIAHLDHGPRDRHTGFNAYEYKHA